MAADKALPGFFEKRELLYAGQPNAGALVALGQTQLGAGVLDGALEAFVRAGNAEGMAQVAEAARAAGDAFSFEAALKAQGKAPAAGEWAALGETALAKGLLWFAYRSFEKADHQDGLERTRREMFAAGIAPPGEAR
jgi:hypothetical protein